MKTGAIISDDGLYRYQLTRRWGPGAVVGFVMLNPSTADAEQDDPTIRKCIGFARRWCYDAITVWNLYAYRATKPTDLWKAADPVGPDNDFYLGIGLDFMADYAQGPIVAAWGANAKPDRVKQFRALAEGRKTGCLGFTKAGQPLHPLMLSYERLLLGWPRT